MPKSPRRPSESRHSRKLGGESNSPALTDREVEEYDPSNISVAGLFENSLRKLSSSYRSSAIEHFNRLTKDVEAEPTLPRVEKVATLYEAIEGMFAAVDRLSACAPEKAPELWRERLDKSEKIFDFIRRVYGPYIGRIKRSDLRHLDESLYKSLYYKPHKAASDLRLPTVEQANDELIAQLEGRVSLADIRNQMPAVLRDRLRLYRTMSTRRHRKRNLVGPKPK